MQDHDQLIDTTGAALEENRRNIRIARELALHAERDWKPYDRALVAIDEALETLKGIVESRIAEDEAAEEEAWG